MKSIVLVSAILFSVKILFSAPARVPNPHAHELIAPSGETIPSMTYKQFMAKRKAEREEVFADMRKQMKLMEEAEKKQVANGKAGVPVSPTAETYDASAGDVPFDLSFWTANKERIHTRLDGMKPEQKMEIMKFYRSLELAQPQTVKTKSGKTFKTGGVGSLTRSELEAGLKKVGLDRELKADR